MARILIVEDNETMREGMVEVARGMGHQPAACPDGESGIGWMVIAGTSCKLFGPG